MHDAEDLAQVFFRRFILDHLRVTSTSEQEELAQLFAALAG